MSALDRTPDASGTMRRRSLVVGGLTAAATAVTLGRAHSALATVGPPALTEGGTWSGGAASAASNVWTFVTSDSIAQRWFDTAGGTLPESPSAPRFVRLGDFAGGGVELAAALRTMNYRRSNLIDPVAISGLIASHEAADLYTYGKLRDGAPLPSSNASRGVYGGVTGLFLASVGGSGTFRQDGFNTALPLSPYISASGNNALQISTSSAPAAFTFAVGMFPEHCQGQGVHLQFDSDQLALKENSPAFWFDGGFSNATSGPLASQSGQGQYMVFLVRSSSAGTLVRVNGRDPGFGTKRPVVTKNFRVGSTDTDPRSTRRVQSVELFDAALSDAQVVAVEQWVAADMGISL